MKTELLKKLFSGFQEKMLSDLNLSKVMTHPCDKGDTKELDWREWLRNLPKRYSVTKGIIVDCNGNTSEQIGAIVYDEQYSPLVFTYNGIKYITAESVYAVFEIKPTLNKTTIDYAAKKTKSVRRLVRTSAPIVYSTGLKNPKPLHRILARLLTTDCGASHITDFLNKNLTDLDKEQELDIICALDTISCSIKYHREKICLLGGAPSEFCSVDINKNKEKDILMHLFLTLNTKLQIIGTVPAIEYDKYFDDVASLATLYEENK